MELTEAYAALRRGANLLSQLNACQKNAALAAVRASIWDARTEILAANSADVSAAREKGTPESLIDRLSLTDARIEAICRSVDAIIMQPDPAGEVVRGFTTNAGLRVKQIRVPFGVAAIIYESRPNVTVDAFALAFKSGNAILLRGSSSAINSNRAIVRAIKQGLASASAQMPDSFAGSLVDTVAIADSGNREEVKDILNAVGSIDIVVPRGSAGLIKTVVEQSSVPVIETGSGICHLYIDDFAYAENPEKEIETAAAVAENAKLQRPGVCNAIECVVVHKNSLESFIPAMMRKFNGRAQLRCDAESLAAAQRAADLLGSRASDTERPTVIPASSADFDTEFLDNILAVKTVASVEEAVEFINAHSTKHSESIITQNMEHAKFFQMRVDAACVYVNASTRFTDGGEFGLGAELGISTQKMHIRGPMGASALTTTKYLIEGEGQIR